MDIPDFTEKIQELEQLVNNQKVVDEASFEQAKGYSQACGPVIRNLQTLIDKIKETEKIINAKMDAYYRISSKRADKPATKPQEAPKEEKPAPSLSLDGFDEEPLSEQDELAAEINKSMGTLF